MSALGSPSIRHPRRVADMRGSVGDTFPAAEPTCRLVRRGAVVLTVTLLLAACAGPPDLPQTRDRGIEEEGYPALAPLGPLLAAVDAGPPTAPAAEAALTERAAALRARAAALRGTVVGSDARERMAQGVEVPPELR